MHAHFDSFWLSHRHLLLVLTVLIFTNGCVNREPADEKIGGLLKKCPAWTRLHPEDDTARKEIMTCLSKISRYDTRAIRVAVEKYIAVNTNHGSQNLDNLSKVFLLNRYLFDVPQLVRPDNPIFGAWRNPIQDGQLDLLWPFSLKPNGRLDLTGAFSGYTGDAYQPLEEFDYFCKAYGLRAQIQP